MADVFEIRDGDLADCQVLTGLFDDAVAWLVARGQTGQWGAKPVSSRPDGLARVQALASGGGLRIAEIAGQPVGALVVGDAPGYAPVVDRVELYILLLFVERRLISACERVIALLTAGISRPT